MSIRTKLTVAIVLVFAVGTFAVARFMHASYSTALDRAAASAIAQGASIFREAEEADTAKLAAVNTTLQQNEEYRSAFASGNREDLLAATRDFFATIKAEQSVTHLYFERTPQQGGSVFLRVHKPEQFDDVLKRTTYLNASKGETQSAGLELGATAVALRVVRPYYSADGATLLGYTETGQEIDSMLDAVKTQTGDTIGLLLSKESMDASGWAGMRAEKGLENNWDDQKTVVLAASTKDAPTDRMVFDGDLSSVPAEGQVLDDAEENGRRIVRGVFPVKDAVGATIGLVYMEHDITAQAAQLHDTQRRIVFTMAAMMIVVLITVLLLMNRLVFHRLNEMIDHMQSVSTRVAGGDYDVTYEKTGANDEIGHFETFFATFISLVGSALSQLSQNQDRG